MLVDPVDRHVFFRRGVAHRLQQVVDDLVAHRGHPHALALPNELQDRARTGVRLAGARRSSACRSIESRCVIEK